MSSPAKEEAKKFIESTVADNQVVVFAMSWCTFCNKTKALMKKPEFKNVSVKIYDMDKMPQGTPSGPALKSMLIEMTGQKTVPSVWINGKFIGGNDDTHEKYKNGELQESLSISVKA